MPGPGKIRFAVGRAHLDRLDDLHEIDAVALREHAPLVQEGEDGRAVGVLDDLRGLGLDRPVHDGERELLGVQHLGQELDDALAGLVADAAADAPEVANAGDVLLARA